MGHCDLGVTVALEEQSEVVASRDLKRGRDVLIRTGTPGVIKKAGWPGLYTVEFRLVDDVDTRVTVRGLRVRDLRPNVVPSIMPTQADHRGS